MRKRGDTNRSRVPVHALWALIGSARWLWASAPDREKLRRVRRSMVPTDEKLANGFGYIESFMAREGVLNIPEAVDKFVDMVRVQRTSRLRTLDKTFEEDSRERVREKAQRYNTMDNRRRWFVERGVGGSGDNAYKKAKEGE